MEVRARYTLVGFFTLAVIAAGFAFVYWLYNSGGLNRRTAYEVRFDGPVSGLLVGSPVLFNGIRSGEVTGLKLDPENPRRVIAAIAVEASTPVRTDTRVGVEFQGLTGSPAVQLIGGGADGKPVEATNGRVPILIADADTGQSLTQATREVVKRIDAVVAENQAPLHTVITSLSTFSEVLARNSERIEGIMSGLERMTGGGSAKAKVVTYDLTAPRSFPPLAKPPAEQIVIPEPTALMSFNTDKILIRKNGEGPTLPEAQWSDTLPALIQAKALASFENAGFLQSVARPTEGLEADYKLLIEIRTFQIAMTGDPAGEVEFAARIVPKEGRTLGAQLFRSSVPAKGIDPPALVAALDQSFGKCMTDLVAWTAKTLAAAPPTKP
jgi:phospholipid/cholesterol/gamma-HCH transport system substrate-binding protein